MTADPAAEGASRPRTVFEELAHLLHDLCQPLTALQCRLEIDQIAREERQVTDRDQMIAECVGECARMNETVAALQGVVRQALAGEQESFG